MRRSTSSVIAALVVLALVSLGCSTTTESTADKPAGVTPPANESAPSDDSEADDDDETDDDQGPAGSRTVPPLALPSEAPGTDQAYRALIEDLDRFITDEQRADGVPWPNLRSADPVTAYRSSAEFQQWMGMTNPTPSLVEAYTAPASPERRFDLELFAEMSAFDLLATPNVPPYEMRVVGVVHPAATEITDALLAQVPDGSVAVVYFDSVGKNALVDPDGRVYRTLPGWDDVGPWVAIMAPTDVGWQVWWDELTEQLPLGLDRDGGSPVAPGSPRDV